MSRIKSFKPVNRHLLVLPHHRKAETQAGVLLPEDFETTRNRYITATVLAVAADCSKAIKETKYNSNQDNKIIIDSSMLECIQVDDKEYNVILENYVVGILRGPDEM